MHLFKLPGEGWSAILFLGLFGSGLAYVFGYDALQVLSLTQTVAFVYLEPFVTIAVAMLFCRRKSGGQAWQEDWGFW